MTRYALIISCEDYTNFKSIAYCEADAALILETLTQYCDYETKNVEWCTQYHECDDTPNVIYDKLNSLINKAENGDTILFYYAGHGLKDGEKGYLLLADSSPSNLSETALDLKIINDLLKFSVADSFIILDACHSGIQARNAFHPYVTNVIPDTGCVTLASCSENEESHPFPEKKQGVFTYYFSEAIRNVAPGQPILIEKIKIDVYENVDKWAKLNYKYQTPTLVGQIVGSPAFATRTEKLYANASLEVENSPTKKGSTIIENMSNTLTLFAEKMDEVLDSTLTSNTPDSSKKIINQNPQSLYGNVLKTWLRENTELQFTESISNNTAWRIFGTTYAYTAILPDKSPCIILVNILKRLNHANVLHSIKNIIEVQDYYNQFGVVYKYYQIIVISEGRDKELIKIMEHTPKFKRLFNRNDISNSVVYLKEGKMHTVFTNNH